MAEPEHFPLITIRGGPHARNMEILQDGVRMKGVTKFVLRGDVNDVAKLYVRQIVRFQGQVKLEASEIETESVRGFSPEGEPWIEDGDPLYSPGPRYAIWDYENQKWDKLPKDWQP